jgi:drug/metabolite transporter (DMT)-like permease
MTPRIPSPGQQHENKKTFAVIILLISVLIIDTSLYRISDLIRVYVTQIWATVYLLGQHILIRFARTKSRQIRELGYLHLKVLDKSVTIIQYLLSGIIVFVLVQVVIFSEFYTSAVSTAAVISYLMAIFMMIFLSLRFFSWFKLHRNPVVLFYLLSTIVLTINAAFSLALLNY